MLLTDLSTVNSTTFGDWQRDYLFKVLILSEPTAPEYQSLKNGFNKDTIDMFVDSFPLPGSKTGATRRKWGGNWAMFPGKLESANTFSVRWAYDESNGLYRFLKACCTLSGADGTGVAVARDKYLFDLGLQLYKTDQVTPGKGYRFVNTWIPEVGDLELDKTKDGLLMFSATFAYDKKIALTND